MATGFTVSADRSEPIGEAHFPLFPCTRSSAGILGQWYIRDGQHGNLSRSFSSPRLPSPFVRLLARSPSLRRGANKIERTHERRSHEACVRACLEWACVSVSREFLSWVDGGLRRTGSDGSSIPSFRTSIRVTMIRGTDHLLLIFQEIDNFVRLEGNCQDSVIVNDSRVVSY